MVKKDPTTKKETTAKKEAEKKKKTAADEEEEQLQEMERVANEMARAQEDDDDEAPRDDIDAMLDLPGDVFNDNPRSANTKKGPSPRQRSRYHFLNKLIGVCKHLDTLGVNVVVLYNDKGAVPHGAMNYLPRLGGTTPQRQVSVFRFARMSKTLQQQVQATVIGLAKAFPDEKIV